MKNYGGEIKYKERTYKLPFNLNVMEEIQEEYGSLDKWSELTEGGEKGEPNVKAIIFGLTKMINEGIEIENEEKGTQEKLLTTRQVGRIVTEVGLAEAMKSITGTVTESTKSDEKNA